MRKAIAIFVKGRVQGVGYRRFVQNAAKEYNILGSVANQRDGSVYISAEGLPKNLDLFVAKCRKGPIRAVVLDFKTIDSDPRNMITSFTIR